MFPGFHLQNLNTLVTVSSKMPVLLKTSLSQRIFEGGHPFYSAAKKKNASLVKPERIFQLLNRHITFVLQRACNLQSITSHLWKSHLIALIDFYINCTSEIY